VTTTETAPSLLGITIRRATVVGRFFLVYGTILAVFLGVSLALASRSSFAASFPLVLPVFGATGSMGALSVFTSDRIKGTLEYLLAYGISPRRLFGEVLAASVVLVTIILSVGVSAGVGVYLARGNPWNETLTLGLGLYALPMTYASAAFATTVGMYWTALSSPRTGMNSPVGVAPLLGVLPPVAVLISVTTLAANGWISGSPQSAIDVGIVAMVLLVVVDLLLLALVGRLLLRERLLSPS
jgi:hypothetical protein